MFVEQQKYIEVELYYKKSKSGNSIQVISDASKIKPEDKANFTKAVFKLRPMTWRTYNDLLRESKATNPLTMSEETDWATYREKKLVKLLAEWDATTKDGDPIQITEEKIMTLHPLVAENLINEYDKKVYLDEEEQKN